MTLVDAGPLIAIIDADDQDHARCKEIMKKLRPPLITAWPVAAEAMYLLGSFRAQDALWEMFLRGVLRLANLDHADLERMRDLMYKYRDLPMDLADAALVRLAERERIRRVFTLDRRDFVLYRPKHLRSLEILP
jgi:predicted nucleic acid-binding protein